MKKEIVKKDKLIAKNMLKFFDEAADLSFMVDPKTKDFTLIIDALELFIKQMKITKEVSQEVKEELGDFTEEDFTKETMKRLLPKIKPIQKKLEEMENIGLNIMLFALPDKKGRKFIELMVELEEAGKLPVKDPTKRERVDKVLNSLEKYLSEIKEISKTFTPATVNPNQTIIFKVMFKYRKGTWRKIELKAANTLEDLHNAIQHAIEWDNDHMYSFFMDNKFSKGDFNAEYTCPYEPEGRKTVDNVKVGMFGFSKAQKFAYLFDFGDKHRFEIEVVDFGIVDESKKYPIILESKGNSPEQYPDYDEE